MKVKRDEVRVVDFSGPLGDAVEDTCRVGFLEYASTVAIPVVHSEKTNHGTASKPGLIDSRDGICYAHSSRAVADARRKGTPSISIGGKRRRLLGSRVDPSYIVLMEAGVDSPNVTSRDSENVPYAVVSEYAGNQSPAVKTVWVLSSFGDSCPFAS